MDFEIKGLDGLLDRLDGLDDKIQDALERGVQKGLLTMQGNQKMLAPVSESMGGELRGSIQTQISTTPEGAVGKTFTNAPHALPNEFGTGQPGKSGQTRGGGELSPEAGSVPHTNKKGWVYYSDKLGRFVYTEGMAAHPFMYPGYKQSEKQIKADIADEVKKAVKGEG